MNDGQRKMTREEVLTGLELTGANAWPYVPPRIQKLCREARALLAQSTPPRERHKRCSLCGGHDHLVHPCPESRCPLRPRAAVGKQPLCPFCDKPIPQVDGGPDDAMPFTQTCANLAPILRAMYDAPPDSAAPPTTGSWVECSNRKGYCDNRLTCYAAGKCQPIAAKRGGVWREVSREEGKRLARRIDARNETDAVDWGSSQEEIDAYLAQRNPDAPRDA
jgi:hypothetical protein